MYKPNQLVVALKPVARFGKIIRASQIHSELANIYIRSKKDTTTIKEA